MAPNNFVCVAIILFLSVALAEYSNYEKQYKYAVDDIRDIFFKIQPTKYKYYQNAQIPDFAFMHKYIADEQECFEYCDKDIHCKWINIVIADNIGHCWLSKPLRQKGVDTYIKVSHGDYIFWNNTDIKGLDIFSQHADSPEECINICDDDPKNCQFFNLKNEEDGDYTCYFKKLQVVLPKVYTAPPKTDPVPSTVELPKQPETVPKISFMWMMFMLSIIFVIVLIIKTNMLTIKRILSEWKIQ